MSEKRKFKILSIDGGGIRGIIPAKVLYHLEEEAIKKMERMPDCAITLT